FFELEDFAPDVDGDLAGEVAGGDGGGDLRDVAHLAGEVGGHGVDGIGEVLPCAGDTGDGSLAAQLAVGAYLAGHARDFRGEDAKLLDHGVDDVGRAEELALERAAVDVEPDGLGQIALCHGGDGARDLGGGPQQVVDQCVDGAFHISPGAAQMLEAGALTGATLLADDLANALQLTCHLFVGGDDFVEAVG